MNQYFITNQADCCSFTVQTDFSFTNRDITKRNLKYLVSITKDYTRHCARFIIVNKKRTSYHLKIRLWLKFRRKLQLLNDEINKLIAFLAQERFTLHLHLTVYGRYVFKHLYFCIQPFYNCTWSAPCRQKRHLVNRSKAEAIFCLCLISIPDLKIEVWVDYVSATDSIFSITLVTNENITG